MQFVPWKRIASSDRPRGAWRAAKLPVGLILALAVAVGVWKYCSRPPTGPVAAGNAPAFGIGAKINFAPRADMDLSGFSLVKSEISPWPADASLAEIGAIWQRAGYRSIEDIDRRLSDDRLPENQRCNLLLDKTLYYLFEADPQRAYEVLEQLRSILETNGFLAQQGLYTTIFFQGVAALRQGENENCIQCRGESSCIIPVLPAAVHTNPEGSRRAIRHFSEYLEKFPDDLAVQWLLNVAHMTLGEHPDKVDPRYLISLDRFRNSEFDIGQFRDVGHVVGLDRFNQAGGAIMEDFDNDGLLDIAVTTFDPTGPMALFRNTGKGTFENSTASAGLSDQLGGLYCVQTDFNNDGLIDIFIVRGAWLKYPIRPTLLRNDGHGTFSDVTREAGLLDPVNSISASWADYDNDGWLDLFICCERQPSRLYHNLGNGGFQEVGRQAGVVTPEKIDCKGSAWLDYDNDGYADLFLNYLTPLGGTQLFHNNRDGSFSEATQAMNVDGPAIGFSCWAWDYDNDGWLDIFATSYDRSLAQIVKGLIGRPHNVQSNRLYHNRQGQGFENKTSEAGLDMVFATMGSNFGDFDNDGFLDMYLGTGDPSLATLRPNRMFKNVAGRRFAEITGTSRTGNLQKGHGVACGDWDRDGDTDIFIEMGGAGNGDRYHNILFQNPGQKNHWLTVKLVGRQTNRPAIGARIKVVTAEPQPLTVYRHISSGSSFGANPLQQTLGLGGADFVDTLEVHWPSSGTTQIFRNVAADQALEITEFADEFRILDWTPIPLPQ